MKLSKSDILSAVRHFNEMPQEDKSKLREQLCKQVDEFFAKGGKVVEVPTGVTTAKESPYGYGYRATQFRNSTLEK